MSDLHNFFAWATQQRGAITLKGGPGSGRYPKGSGEGEEGGIRGGLGSSATAQSDKDTVSLLLKKNSRKRSYESALDDIATNKHKAAAYYISGDGDLHALNKTVYHTDMDKKLKAENISAVEHLVRVSPSWKMVAIEHDSRYTTVHQKGLIASLKKDISSYGVEIVEEDHALKGKR